MKHFKVKLEFRESQRALNPCELWLAVRAKSIGEAVVIAENRCLGKQFELCDNPAVEITEQEYYRMINVARHHGEPCDTKASKPRGLRL